VLWCPQRFQHTMIGSSLHPVVCRSIHVLLMFFLYLFVNGGVQHVLTVWVIWRLIRDMNCLPFGSTWIHHRFLMGSVLLIFLVFCDVLCFVWLNIYVIHLQGRIQDLWLGGVSRRGGTRQSPGRGPRGAKPSEALEVWGITDIYLNDNFEPTTPFLSDQKNLTLNLNFVG
jgi:hypothetical protein